MTIIKHDEDNFQIDGDMYNSDDFEDIDSWNQIEELLGSDAAKQMKHKGYDVHQIIAFITEIAA